MKHMQCIKVLERQQRHVKWVGGTGKTSGKYFSQKADIDSSGRRAETLAHPAENTVSGRRIVESRQ